jgi:hypothetical protein
MTTNIPLAQTTTRDDRICDRDDATMTTMTTRTRTTRPPTMGAAMSTS